ncbi:RNA-binding domain-containing protein [Annulohypoxylon truncatum]|uniref:RNA-binding domain-containing protein n=1 Tax=Annulohypoxylon truncatum TaxID=327061 RepID=UPI0020078B55|nr:RNA-binding domain-containing protein [Annulohypoxylon truncatum]KAI1210805.1 RNA-binding domain-containing protein [Annulohypoxylon truncatum]
MSDSGNWRDSSNWRMGVSGPSPARNPRAPYQSRTTTSSWRTNHTDTAAGDGEPRSEPRPRQRNNWVPGSHHINRERSNGNPQSDESSVAKAIAEGRRIYIGNLRYEAKPDDIEEILKANELGNFESIHMSIDHFTGRNPSYCFVEFPDRDSADRAMTTLNGKVLLGREVKCRPCVPKGSDSQKSAGLDRWSRWNKGSPRSEQTPESGKEGLRYKKDFAGQRLYVGGLSRTFDHATNSAEMSELFKDFQVDAISKRIMANQSARSKPGNHDYCFVDFATPEEAQAAMDALNGIDFRGSKLKVNLASGRSPKWQERDNLNANDADEPIKQESEIQA